jgi:hypothetical protein
VNSTAVDVGDPLGTAEDAVVAPADALALGPEATGVAAVSFG